MKKTSAIAPARFAAFLRGINVGGRILKMADLKKALEKMGLKDVKTIGASGNALFSAESNDAGALVKTIEAGLQKSFSMAVSVIVRSVEQLRAMIDAGPFKGITVTPETRLYVTFLAAPTKPKSGLRIPYQSPKKDLSILALTPGEIYCMVDLSSGGSTIDAMGLIEKEFGKNVTTRNWNTINKLA